MPDPRIARTRDHVISAARRMLTDDSGMPPTFKRLSETSLVNQQTIKKNWPTIEEVLVDAAGLRSNFVPTVATGSGRARLRHFLSELRGRLADPVVVTALTFLMARATYDSRASEILAEIASFERAQFNLYVTFATHQQYAALVAPLFFIVLGARRVLDAETLEKTVEAGCQTFDLGSEGGELIRLLR